MLLDELLRQVLLDELLQVAASGAVVVHLGAPWCGVFLGSFDIGTGFYILQSCAPEPDS